MRQDRCMVVLGWIDASIPEVLPPEVIETEGGPRTARNMLKPTGIPRDAWVREDWTSKEDYPDWILAAAAPCHIVGETTRRKAPIFSPDGCLPDAVGALMVTDRGVR